MTKLLRHSASCAALLAACTMGAAPASAAPLPAIAHSQQAIETGAGEVQNNHRYRDYRHHRRGGIGAGDVIAGVLVIGAIAAIAGAGRNDRERTRDRDYPRSQNARYRTRDDAPRYESSGIERAVDMCVDQVERGDTRVGSVNDAARTADGWRVSGALEAGSAWNCWIDNDGRVREVNLGDSGFSAARAEGSDRQLSDADYARARAEVRSEAPAGYTYSRTQQATDDAPRAAYPGGPVEGEEQYPGGEWRGDDEYTSAAAS